MCVTFNNNILLAECEYKQDKHPANEFLRESEMQTQRGIFCGSLICCLHR